MKSKLWLVGCLALVLLGATLNSWRWRYWRQFSMLQGAAIGKARRPRLRDSKYLFPRAEDL